jgi:putative DNA primase/helicase
MSDGAINRWIDEAEQHLIARDKEIWSFGDFVVRIAPSPITISENRESVALRVVTIRNQHMVERFSACCKFLTYDARSESWVPKVCPPSVAQAYLERVGTWHLPPLTSIIAAPIMRRDGAILDQPGYDKQTGLFYDPRGADFPPVPERPTKEDAIAALAFIASLYSEVAFEGRVEGEPDLTPSLSVELSKILTALMRPVLRAAPMHAADAFAAGSGKSMLTDTAAMIATGTEAAAVSGGGGPDELYKTLAAELIAGSPIINFDNLERPVGGELINSILTQSKVRVRVLGTKDMAEIPNRALICANGNGIEIMGDLGRRTIKSTIDAGVERPWRRKFTTEFPVERARRDRGRYAIAALTALRAFVLAGSPPHQRDPLGSFPEWDALIRGLLIWCGYADPCDTMEQIQVTSSDHQRLSAVLHRWHTDLGEDYLTTGGLIKKATEYKDRQGIDLGRPEFIFPELREALLAVAGAGGAINSARLGRWISKHNGRIVDGRKIERGTLSDGYQQWRVVKPFPRDGDEPS